MKIIFEGKFRPIVVILLLFVSISTYSQDTYKILGDSTKKIEGNKVSLTGTIFTAEDKLPLQGAALFIDGLKFGNNSDVYGRYFLSLPRGRYRLTVRHLGKAPIQLKVAIYENSKLDFEMVEKSEALEEVVVRAREEDANVKEPLSGVITLNITEIKRMPAFMGEVDIIRNLQMLPGVSTVGEGSSGFNVRGGRVDQNLVLMDDGIVLNPSHALGILSNFNPDAVEDFSLYKGNIPAQYGGRTSSVLSVRTRDGDFNKFKTKLGVGLLSSRIAVEGPIVPDKTSFLIASRFSYSDWILRQVNNVDVKNSAASFYDINGNLTHKLGKRSSLSLLYYLGHDNFKFSNKFGYEYTTQLVTLRYKQILSDNLGSTFSAVLGNYSAKLSDLEPVSARTFNNGMDHVQLKENIIYTSPNQKHAINLGAEGIFYSPKPEESGPLGTNSSAVSDKLKKSGGIEAALYADETFNIGEAISVSAGLRYSFFQNYGPDTVYQYQSGVSKTANSITDTMHYASGSSIANYGGLEPRLSIRFGLTKESSIKASYARLRQYVHLISNTTATTPVDIWQVSNTYFNPQVADNFSLGYFRNLKENMFEASAEVFYRTTSNIVDYKDFSQIILNRHLETDVLQGDGKAYGLELFLKKNSGGWTGWISYTYTRSLIKMNGNYPDEIINKGDWYPANYDKPHNLSITASHKLGKNMRFGGNFNYSTGRPISAIESYYSSGSISIPVFSERNLYRIPDYWRVDVSITLNSVLKKFDDSLTFSIYNLFGRANAYSIYYQQVDGYPALQSYKLSILGSALPSLTYNINF